MRDISITLCILTSNSHHLLCTYNTQHIICYVKHLEKWYGWYIPIVSYPAIITYIYELRKTGTKTTQVCSFVSDFLVGTLTVSSQYI